MLYKRLGRLVVVALIAVMLVQLAACGTLLYPERRGQRGGTVDTAVVLLDCVGLFIFIIPGIVALAVDFSNGAIYLPHSDRPRSSLGQDLYVIKVPPSELTFAKVRQIVREHTGADVDFGSPRMLHYTLKYGEMDRLASILNNGGALAMDTVVSH